MAKRYFALAPPLRISESETGIYQKLAEEWMSVQPAPRVLVMGATPDFYHLPWPAHTELLAADISAQMLAEVWPGDKSQRTCQDWTRLDLPDSSRDLAFCDGGLTFFPGLTELQQVADQLGRIIAPGGLFMVRLYVAADRFESPAEVFDELKEGRIHNSSELKLRLWFALKAPGNEGVCLHDVWQSFHACYPNPELLTRTNSWPLSEIESMRAYENMQDRYYFPSVEQVSEIWAHSSGGFTLEANLTPAGPCSQHLKILSFRRNH